MSNDVLHDDVTGPRSIRDRAENGDPGVPEAELFPKGSLPGELAPQSYVKKNLPAELAVAFMRGEFPLRGTGVPDPSKYGRAVVTYLPRKKHEELVLEDKNDPTSATSAKVCVDLQVVHVADANDTARLVRSEFEVLLAEDEKAARELFEGLREMMAVYHS
jgi:hypothetical protein